MVSTQGGSTVARRQLGRRLRRLREEAGRSIEDVAGALLASRSKMWKIENGRIKVKQGDVLALTRFYGAAGRETDQLVALAAATGVVGIIGEGSAVLPWLGPYADFEANCSMLREYRCELVHGLLQISDYARAVIAADPGLSPAMVEERLAFRMERQRAYFERPDPGRLDFVVTEGALGVTVGSPSVMEAQIARLRAVDSGDGVSVRVLRSANGVHTAMGCTFTIMDFADPEDPPLVYLESLNSSRYVETVEHIAEFRQVFDRIRAQAVPLEDYLR
jgi:transcriptional regulator with XRE-family HTH domain